MSDHREPAFAEPWHAQVFALTVHLSESGFMTWPDWAARFSAQLKQNGLNAELDGGDDYFQAWLEALEALLAEAAPETERETIKAAWEQAYLSTPHGQPVALKD